MDIKIQSISFITSLLTFYTKGDIGIHNKKQHRPEPYIGTERCFLFCVMIYRAFVSISSMTFARNSSTLIAPMSPCFLDLTEITFPSISLSPQRII